jgi:glycosyltransferase involved in cell wall biosynthesis
VNNGWCDVDRVAIIANGVEPDFFVAPVHQGRGRAVLFLGQWLPMKGTCYLVEAFRTIASANERATLVCVGTGASAETVLCNFDPPLRERIRVVPRLDRAELLHELLRADVVLFPTLSEGFSGALLEAMATGRAIAATRAGVAAELLDNDVNAVVVPFADAEALADAAIRLLENPELRQRLGEAALHSARPYTWDAVSERFSTELMRDGAEGRTLSTDGTGVRVA